jgi:hypothetical protein
MMDRIIRAAERQPGAFLTRVRSEHRTTEDTSGTISHAACTMATIDPRVKAIVAFTRSGYTARLLSMDRPPVPILSISPDPAVRNRCALYWGTIAAISDESEGLLSMTITADEQARAVLGLREGDFIIIAGGWPRDLAATTNLLKVHRFARLTFAEELRRVNRVQYLTPAGRSNPPCAKPSSSTPAGRHSDGPAPGASSRTSRTSSSWSRCSKPSSSGTGSTPRSSTSSSSGPSVSRDR